MKGARSPLHLPLHQLTSYAGRLLPPPSGKPHSHLFCGYVLPSSQNQGCFFLSLFLYCKIKHFGCKILGRSRKCTGENTIAHNTPSQTFQDNHNIFDVFLVAFSPWLHIFKEMYNTYLSKMLTELSQGEEKEVVSFGLPFTLGSFRSCGWGHVPVTLPICLP